MKNLRTLTWLFANYFSGWRAWSHSRLKRQLRLFEGFEPSTLLYYFTVEQHYSDRSSKKKSFLILFISDFSNDRDYLNELFKVFREKIRKIFEAQPEFGSLTKTGKSEFLNEKSSPGGVFMSLSYPYLRLPFVTVSMHFVACQVQLSQHVLLLFTFCCMNKMHRSILDWTPPKCMFTVSIHPMQGL